MLRLEIRQVLHVLLILRCLLILGKLSVILFLVSMRFRFIRLLLGRSQVLPVFTDQLGNLGKRKVAALEVLTHLFKWVIVLVAFPTVLPSG